MALEIGTQLGAYRITGQIGAGGMGDVYRATDTKLGRDVAIKTLPGALAADADRLARLEREAKLLASLNHAHIASIYGLDEHDGTRFISMELVDGETLEQKLKKGRLAADDAFRVALQIAEALEAAHAKGVVHRDLKPANVMLTPDGVVKVLDFGLARAYSGDQNDAAPAHSPALSLAMTQAGLVLGTAGYMSPEQASGQATDPRADIWAFGVVLYEMLTGMPPFAGESVPHVHAAVLKADPDWRRLPKRLHPRLKLLLEHCLQKKPRERWHAIADARIEIEEVLRDPAGVEPTIASGGPARPRVVVAAVAMTVAVSAGAGALLAWWFWPDTEAGQVARFAVAIDGPLPFAIPVISRDGTRIAMTMGEPAAIHVRDVDDFEPTAVADTLNNRPTGPPCFSPDGASIAYASNLGTLRRAPVAGGRGTSLSGDGAVAVGACAWGSDGHVYFEAAEGISRVPESGGAAETLVELDAEAGETRMAPLQFLPGGQRLLAAVVVNTGDALRLPVVVIDLESGQTTTLLDDGGIAKFTSSVNDPSIGHLMYGRDGTIFAAPLDLERLELGTSRPVVANVLGTGVLASGTVADVSENGTLVYFWSNSSGQAAAANVTEIAVLARDGRETRSFAAEQPGPAGQVSLSPDGRRNATAIVADNGLDLWVHGTEPSPFTRLTFSGINGFSVWTPDSLRLIYASVDFLTQSTELRSIPTDGSEGPSPLLAQANALLLPTSISPDGGTLLGTAVAPNGGSDIWALTLPSEAEQATSDDLRFFLRSELFSEQHASFSPDGRWVAYNSDETGDHEIFVQPFPGPGSKARVSLDGGLQPRWNPGGGELFYLAGNRMMAVPVAEESGQLRIGRPRELFVHARLTQSVDNLPRYDVMPDASQFIVLQRPAEFTSVSAQRIELRVVQNWFEELNGLVPLE